jgi:tRNA G18 (ribose-2'-O)-methylase SpoU
MKRGYCGIGIWHPSKEVNVGTLFRSALALDADFVFTIGRRYSRQSSDTPNTIRHLPYYHYESFEDFKRNRPKGARLVCLEITENARDLRNFCHPEQAIYLLGSEGGGLPAELLRDNLVVKVQSQVCLNVSVMGSLCLYDRHAKMGAK